MFSEVFYSRWFPSSLLQPYESYHSTDTKLVVVNAFCDTKVIKFMANTAAFLVTLCMYITSSTLTDSDVQGADKSLARPGRKQAMATEDFEFHISYL